MLLAAFLFWIVIYGLFDIYAIIDHLAEKFSNATSEAGKNIIISLKEIKPISIGRNAEENGE